MRKRKGCAAKADRPLNFRQVADNLLENALQLREPYWFCEKGCRAGFDHDRVPAMQGSRE